MLLLLTSSALAQELTCAAELSDSLRSGEQAFLAREKDGVAQQAQALPRHLQCMDEVLEPAQAARVHGLRGLAAFLEQDTAGMEASFQAARAADPSYDFPTTALPPDHPVRQAFDAAADPASSMEPVALPEDWTLFVDGAPAAERPTDRPALVQIDDDAPGLLVSVVLDPGEPLELPPAFPPAPELPSTTSEGLPLAPISLAAGALVLGGTSAALGLAAHSAETRYWASTSVEAASTTRGRVNALSTAATVLGGAAAVTGGAAVVVTVRR